MLIHVSNWGHWTFRFLGRTEKITHFYNYGKAPYVVLNHPSYVMSQMEYCGNSVEIPLPEKTPNQRKTAFATLISHQLFLHPNNQQSRQTLKKGYEFPMVFPGVPKR